MKGPAIVCLEKKAQREQPGLFSRFQRRNTVNETEAIAVPELSEDGPLYAELPTAPSKRLRIQMIPYYAWNNRGEPEMSIWLPLR